jgi:hypothetical protein
MDQVVEIAVTPLWCWACGTSFGVRLPAADKALSPEGTTLFSRLFSNLASSTPSSLPQVWTSASQSTLPGTEP